MADTEKERYFEWIYDMFVVGKIAEGQNYRKLFTQLFRTPFCSKIFLDKNRESDGLNLRRRYGITKRRDPEYLDIKGPCNILEMIAALAIRCEESIMDDTSYGNRTAQWFWMMINSLGLGGQFDDNYDQKIVSEILTKFLNREYEPNGKGGLFYIRSCTHDLREVEIWDQMNWYLNTIT